MDFMPDPITDFITDTIEWLTDMAVGADAWQQFLVLMLAGAIPFVESYIGSFLGVLLGVSSPLAVSAAVVGNVVCMLVLTALVSKTRSAVTGLGRSAGPRAVAGAQVGAQDVAQGGDTAVAVDSASITGSKRRRKVAGLLERFGVPGVSFLTPLVLPTQITAPILVGAGARPASVYGYMTASIIAWGVLFGFFGDWVSGWFF